MSLRCSLREYHSSEGAYVAVLEFLLEKESQSLWINNRPRVGRGGEGTCEDEEEEEDELLVKERSLMVEDDLLCLAILFFLLKPKLGTAATRSRVNPEGPDGC